MLLQALAHDDGAIVCWSFFITRNQKGNRALMIGMSHNKFFSGNHKSCKRGFHIGSATAIEHAITNGWCEWIACPFF